MKKQLEQDMVQRMVNEKNKRKKVELLIELMEKATESLKKERDHEVWEKIIDENLETLEKYRTSLKSSDNS